MVWSRRPGGRGAQDDEGVQPAWGPGLLQPVTWRNPHVRRLAMVSAVLGCAGLGALAIGFLVFIASLDRSEREPAARADGIVALTGGAQRIGDAIDLLAKGYGRRLLITGVNERTTRREIARLNPGQRELFDCCVDLDYRARNTIGNAIETRRWSRYNRFSSLIVVTSNYHMPRTMVELDHALPEARKVPYAVVSDAEGPGQSLMQARRLAYEYVKYLVVRVRTSLESDPERSTAAIMMSRGRPIRMVSEPFRTH